MLLLDSASSLSRASDARAILVYADGLPAIPAVPARTILIVRGSGDADRARELLASASGTITVPAVTLSRYGQITLSIFFGLSGGLIDVGDTVVCLTGPYRKIIDTIQVMTVGREFELFDQREGDVAEPTGRAVFHRVLGIALQLGQHGREGRRMGALFVIGDSESVLRQSEQMILNPFRGYSEEERNVLDDRMSETLKEFSALDGAFIISEKGLVETAGAHVRAGMSGGLLHGLGARHAAAAGITALTRAIAITVSASDGTVRVWRAGREVAEFEPEM
jgi:DNA integrity scanning protein DisA with diadenylate cyclase activity